MTFDLKQAKAETEGLRNELLKAQAAYELSRPETDAARAEANKINAEAALRRAGKPPTAKPTFNPSSYAEFRKLYKAENDKETDEAKIDAGARALMEKARTASNKANEDVGAIGRLPGAGSRADREADVRDNPAKYLSITTPEELDRFLETGELPK